MGPKNKSNDEPNETLHEKELNVQELFQKATEKRLITWVPIGKDPWTTLEFVSFLESVTDLVNPSETGAKIEYR